MLLSEAGTPARRLLPEAGRETRKYDKVSVPFCQKITRIWLHTCFVLENAFLNWVPSFFITFVLDVSGLASGRAFLSLIPMMDAEGA